MKRFVILMCCLISYMAVFAQEGLKEGDEMAAAGDFDGAAAMYRKCSESNEPCALKLFKLIYDEKVKALMPDEPFQLINPLAAKGDAEAQFYLSELYRKGIGGVEQNNDEALIWLQKSAEQNFSAAKTALENLPRKEEPNPESPGREETVRDEPIKIITDTPPIGSDIILHPAPNLKPSKMPVVLYSVGGVAIVAGIAVTYLIPAKTSDDFSSSNETGKYLEVQKRNPVFLIAGGVIGGVCIGSGIIIKKKNSAKLSAASFDNDVPQSFPHPNDDLRLNLIATNNGAGLRLTF